MKTVTVLCLLYYFDELQVYHQICLLFLCRYFKKHTPQVYGNGVRGIDMEQLILRICLFPNLSVRISILICNQNSAMGGKAAHVRLNASLQF